MDKEYYDNHFNELISIRNIERIDYLKELFNKLKLFTTQNKIDLELAKLIGNILTDSYEKIWSQNNYFNKLRNLKYLTNEKCKNCQYINKCRGGCPILYMLSENMGNNFYDKFEQ